MKCEFSTQKPESIILKGVIYESESYVSHIIDVILILGLCLSKRNGGGSTQTFYFGQNTNEKTKMHFNKVKVSIKSKSTCRVYNIP